MPFRSRRNEAHIHASFPCPPSRWSPEERFIILKLRAPGFPPLQALAACRALHCAGCAVSSSKLESSTSERQVAVRQLNQPATRGLSVISVRRLFFSFISLPLIPAASREKC
jgi:hypothetical protein